MTFEYWISMHIKQDTSIGDLARDYKYMCKEYKLKGLKKPKLTLRHLIDNNACSDAIDAYREARSLYASFISNMKKV